MSTHAIRLPAGLVLALLLAGCASGPKRTSGFLGDYSQLRRHKERKTTYVYYKPGVDLRDYDRLIIDPIQVKPLPGSTAESMGKADQRKFSDAFRRILMGTIAPYYSVVGEASPTALRLRLAITDVRPAGTTGRQHDLGGAAVEGELLDAVSGERLAAFTDVREGSTEGKTAPEQWRAVEGAFREWAQRILDYIDTAGE